MLPATGRPRVGDSQLLQVIRLAESVGMTDGLADGEECMYFEDVSRLHVLFVKIFASEEASSWTLSNEVFNCFFRFQQSTT